MRRIGGHEGPPVEATWPVFAVLAGAIVTDFTRWRALHKIAKETGSDALAADALHFSSDLIGTILVLLGLLATRFGFQHGDAAAAIGVAIFISIAGYRLGRQTINTLVDAAPKGLAERIRAVANAVPGVVGVDFVRLRPVGPQVVGELSIAVPRTLPLERVPAIKAAILDAIAVEMPEANVTISANPRAIDDESVIERVLLIAARRRLPVHHLTIQEIDGVKSISLDLEVDARWTHGRAHEAASALETSIREELGGAIEVDTHIEPLEPNELRGADAGANKTAAVAESLRRHAVASAIVHDIHDVRVRANPNGLVVNYHCRVNPSLTVEQVHSAVDDLDRYTRLDFPAIFRIVGHAEPDQR